MNGGAPLNILVTGGAGYIGSHTSKALAKLGHIPVAYDNLSRGHRDAVKFGPLEVGDIADSARVLEVLERYQPAAVMHFAALAYVGESVEKPLFYYKNNVTGSIGLLKAVTEFGPIPFVFSSTCATSRAARPIADQRGSSAAADQSLRILQFIVERMLADLEVSHRLRWVALRYFNAAGCDPDGEIGEVHDPETHLIPLVLEAARGGTPIHIFGTDYNTPDGTCIRDYVHVMDIADAHVRAMDFLFKGGSSGAFNLANTTGYSVRASHRRGRKDLRTNNSHQSCCTPRWGSSHADRIVLTGARNSWLVAQPI